MHSTPVPFRRLSFAVAFGLLLLTGWGLSGANDEDESSDAATTVKKSIADGLPGKWRAKFEIDEEKLKKEGGAEGAELIRGMLGKATLLLEIKADGAYSVTMENVGAEPGEQKQDGKWKVLKEDDKKLTLEFFENEKPQKMEFTFESADRFTLKPEDDLGPLKPPVFNRVKDKDEKEQKTEKAKE